MISKIKFLCLLTILMFILSPISQSQRRIFKAAGAASISSYVIDFFLDVIELKNHRSNNNKAQVDIDPFLKDLVLY